MPACDHCGQVVPQVTLNNNGRTPLRLCSMCQAELELKSTPSLRPAEITSLQEPWWRRWMRKLRGS
jgi:hypothetical protein